MARDEGWMAEHMLILGIEDPQGRKRTTSRRHFPSACGKTNFAMLIPPPHFRAGWKVWTVGDDIAWIKPDERPLARHQSRGGFFGVRPARSEDQPERDGTLCREHHLHQRRAHARGGVWWEGMTDDRRDGDRLAGQCWTPDIAKRPARTPRIRTPLHGARAAVPDDRPGLGNPNGVPISAFIFGGRRATTMPLFTRHSTGRAASTSAPRWVGNDAPRPRHVGKVRRDPMAMLPFCGYNMGDYFRHWINMQRCSRDAAHLPRELVPQGQDGKFMWPDSREHACLKWIFDRVAAAAAREETPIGWVPRYKDMEWPAGFPEREVRGVAGVRPQAWRDEVIGQEELFIDLHSTLPKELVYERELLICRM
jgi:phosphoenolpyruvate carboxykinase (GTP)